MYDLKRSWASSRLGRQLAAGSTISQEGVLLCAVIEDGIEKAALVASPSGDEKVIGFAITADSLPDRTVAVDNIVVPASGSLIVALQQQNLVSGRVRVFDVTNNVALTVDNTFAGSPGAGVVKVDLAGGQLKFNAAQAGLPMVVTVLYDLTMIQADQFFGERFVNNRGLHAMFGQIELGAGFCELYTDQFDASADWANAATINLGPNGIVVVGGAGPSLPGVVVNVPSSAVPFLGLRIRFMP